MDVARARIVVLGGLSIRRDDDATKLASLPGMRAELVFAYRAVEHRRSVTRDELANALWPGLLPDSWAAALRGVVTEVRRFIDEAGLPASELIATVRGGGLHRDQSGRRVRAPHSARRSSSDRPSESRRWPPP